MKYGVYENNFPLVKRVATRILLIQYNNIRASKSYISLSNCKHFYLENDGLALQTRSNEGETTSNCLWLIVMGKGRLTI